MVACDISAALRRSLQQEARFRQEVSALEERQALRFTSVRVVHQPVHSSEDGYSRLEMDLEEDAVLAGLVTAMSEEAVRTLNLHKMLVLGSLIFQVSYQVTSFLSLCLIILPTMVALYGMGMMSASMFLLFNREAWHLAYPAQEPDFLLPGFYFPVKNLGFWLALGASIIFSRAIFPQQILPAGLHWIGYLMLITTGLEHLRRALYGPVIASLPALPALTKAMVMVTLMGLSARYAFLAAFLFRRCEETARERGVTEVVTNS